MRSTLDSTGLATGSRKLATDAAQLRSAGREVAQADPTLVAAEHPLLASALAEFLRTHLVAFEVLARGSEALGEEVTAAVQARHRVDSRVAVLMASLV